MQTGVTLERQITKSSNIAVTYLNSRGVHQFYTDNLNPADPITGMRPDGINNIYQYQSDGTFKQNQLIINGSIRMGAKLSLVWVLHVELSPTAIPLAPALFHRSPEIFRRTMAARLLIYATAYLSAVRSVCHGDFG